MAKFDLESRVNMTLGNSKILAVSESVSVSIWFFAVLISVFACDDLASGQEPKKSQWPPGHQVHLTKQAASKTETFVKVVNNRAWQGTPISIGSKVYRRGLGVHADSRLEFDLDGAFKSFHVTPGPDDVSSGTIEMKILVDEKQVFASGSTHSRDKKERKRLSIDVAGAKKLTLIVTNPDGNLGGDHASWGNAFLLRPGGGNVPVATKPAPVNTMVRKEKLLPFLKNYCFDCHGPDVQEADVRFDQSNWVINNNDSAQRWQDVLDQLNGGDMPPAGETRPSDAELSQALKTLTGSILTARKRLTDHGGEIAMRRLNRREYNETIKDLFGFEVLLKEIPEDGEFTKFDTVGAEQLFTSSHFEKYHKLAKRIAKEALALSMAPLPKTTKKRVQVEAKVLQTLQKRLTENDRKFAGIKAKKSWKEIGFADEGDKEIFHRQYWINTVVPRRYFEFPKAGSGVYLTGINGCTDVIRTVQWMDPRGDYVYRIHAGVVGNPDQLRRVLQVNDRRKVWGTLRVEGTVEKPKTLEIRRRGGVLGERHNVLMATEHFPRYQHRKVFESKDPQKLENPWASIFIDWVEVEGPIFDKQRPKFEKLLYPNGFSHQVRATWMTDARAAELIQKFATEAFRRKPPKPQFVAALIKQYKENRAAGMKFEDAMTDVFAIILASPSFLYLQEDSAVATASRQLDNREMGIRLSYFLWSCPPDEELYKADLSDPKILEQQVDRMLANPKSKAFLEGFVDQWAEMDRFEAITVDEKEHPEFNDNFKIAAKQEVRELFATLLEENLPVANLIDSKFVVVNSILAEHYGIAQPKFDNDKFQKVSLADSPRGGLMTTAAFLTAGSNGERSSPVIRGALVMEKLLNDKPAPPPPNVPELGSDSGKPKTNREMVLLHQKQAVCASCHRQMDVIGFGLENFDTTGRWRDTEKVGKRQVKIKPGGKLPSGVAFNNVRQLKKVLLKEEDRLAKEMTESILAYALGRTVEFSDADDVEGILNRLKPTGYQLNSMVKGIATNPLFRKK